MIKQEPIASIKIDLALTSEEKRSELWGKTFKVIEARIWKLREQNDRPLSEADTLALRTEIKVLKGMLKNDPAREFSEPHKAVTQTELDMADE